MKLNIIKYIDCMDIEEGLPSLEDNSIEMCFTDPPYNVNFKKKRSKNDKRFNILSSAIIYPDNMIYEEYIEWCKSWFFELKRVCYGVILIHCGNSNLNMWIADIEKPTGILWHYKEDVQSQDSVAYLMKMTPILVYRKPKKRFKINPIRIKNKYDKTRGHFLHPCPMNYYLIKEVLKRQKPETLIDPFTGSGAIPHVCKLLGIKFIGYEINKEYKQDIKKRFNQESIDIWGDK